MKLRSGRVLFNNNIEGGRFLNIYCSISQIKNRTIFKKHLKKIINEWYLWLIEQQAKSKFLISPWFLFSISLYDNWNRIK